MLEKATTTGEIIVRDMIQDDIPEVVALDLRVTGLQGPVARSGVVDSYVTGELGLSCVAEAAGQIVGYILGRLAYTPAPVTESAWIQLIGVDWTYRRQGVGGRLVDRFRQRCQERGARIVHIAVPTQDSAVQAFLEDCGFCPVEWTHFSAPVKE